MATETLAAVVLAAGLGRRLGGMPKALIAVNGQALVVRWVQCLQAAGVGPIALVTAGHTAAVTAELHRSFGAVPDHVQVIEVPPDLDQMDSLQRGLRHLAGGGSAVMVCLVDQPLVDRDDVLDLVQAYAHRPDGTDLVLPWAQGQPGHPVLLSPPLAAAWCLAEPAHLGKTWRAQHPQRVYRWHTASDHYTTDLDTPADVERLRLAGWQVELPRP